MPRKRRCSTYFFAAGSPLRGDERLPHHRRDDLGLRHVFARHGPVVEHARGAVQVPLARLVERLEDVLHVIARVVLPPVADRPCGDRRELDDPFLQVQLGDEVDRRGPGVVDDDQGVAEVVPPAGCRRRGNGSPAWRRCWGRPLRAVERRQDVLGVEEALVGRAGPGAALAVHKELMEVPPAFLDAGYHRLPERALPFLPARDRPAAGDDRPLGSIGGVGDGGLLGAGIRGRELDGLLDPINTSSQVDGHGFLERPGSLETPHRVPSALGRGKRAVGPRGVRLGECARPGVVAIVGHVIGGGGESAAGCEECDDEEHT